MLISTNTLITRRNLPPSQNRPRIRLLHDWHSVLASLEGDCSLTRHLSFADSLPNASTIRRVLHTCLSLLPFSVRVTSVIWRHECIRQASTCVLNQFSWAFASTYLPDMLRETRPACLVDLTIFLRLFRSGKKSSSRAYRHSFVSLWTTLDLTAVRGGREVLSFNWLLRHLVNTISVKILPMYPSFTRCSFILIALKHQYCEDY